ncbi:hypothetical protein [Thalassovita sp.]|uniref:hypothetical protein n=1 Tax=Thalassovita sp. TaxID=1979401 RepID=UPI002AB0FC7D|nr:hypothetical protein [Thalassovita sp.]
MLTTVAYAYALICCCVIGFQIALIAGAPWGRITQGGQVDGPLPRRGRVLAAVSIFILAFMALSVLSAAGLVVDWPKWTAWVALVVQALSALANWITPSAPERRLWGPITTVMLLCAGYVAMSA